MTNVPTKSKNQDKSKMCEIDDQILRMFEFKKRLGKGAYGIVWKALDKRSNETVAVKKIFDAFRDETDAQRTFREITFLNAFRSHPNIVMLHNVFKASNNLDIYLVFEFMDTDLHNIIKRGAVLKDVHKRYIMYQLINAVKYIHSGNVIHRDLKPSNILVDCKCRCKLADFGLARSVLFRDSGREDPVGVPLLTDYVATRWYRAPEILVASKRYTKGIDMWSLGCILGEMLLGKPLFQGTSTVNQIERIVMTLPRITDQDVKAVGADFGAVLLNKQISRERSISLEEMLGEVPSDAMDLVKKLLVLDPLERLTAQQALEHSFVAKYRNPGSERNVQGNIVPPLNDDIRLTVPEYRTKLYEIVGEVPITTNKKQTNLQKKKTRADNQKTIMAYDKTPLSTKSRNKTHNAQINQPSVKTQQSNKDLKAKHAFQAKDVTKIEVPLRTMIGNLSSKLKKESHPQEGMTLPSFKRSITKMEKMGNQSPKIEPINDNTTNTIMDKSCHKICRERSMHTQKIQIPENLLKTSIFTNYPKIKNHKTLTGQHEKYLSINNFNTINNISSRKNMPHILPSEKNEQTKLQSHFRVFENKIKTIKSSDLHSVANQVVKNDKNVSHHVPTRLGTREVSRHNSSSVLQVIVYENANNIANEKTNETMMKEMSKVKRQQSQGSIKAAIKNKDREEIIHVVGKDKRNEPNNGKCVCYEERLRRIEREIKGYEQEVQSFAHDTMLLKQKRLRSAESMLAVRKPCFSNSQLISDQPKTRYSLESKRALVGRVSFAGSSFGESVTNNNYKNYINSPIIDSGNDSKKSAREMPPEKSSILNLPSVNAKNPLLKILPTYRGKLPSGDGGTGGSGDHIRSTVDYKHVDVSVKEPQHQKHKLKRSVSTLLKPHLLSSLSNLQNQSQINAEIVQCSGSNPLRNFRSDSCYSSYCKRKSTKAF